MNINAAWHSAITMPKTRQGTLSFKLLVTFFVLFTLMQALIASGQRGGDTFFDNLYLSIPGLLMLASAIASFFTGTLAVVKYKERSIWVIAAIILGLCVLVFVMGEFFFPHD